VKYIMNPVHRRCGSKCGLKETTVATEVPQCIREQDGQKVPNTECEHLAVAKPTNGKTKTCPATSSCYKYKTERYSGTCPTECGAKASTLEGKVKCIDNSYSSSHGNEVADNMCSKDGLVKPAVPTKKCKATKACFTVSASEPHGSCPTQCGQPSSTLKGMLYCRNKYGHQTQMSYCDNAGLTRPAVKTKHCDATSPCPVNGYCSCVVKAYRDNHYRGGVLGTFDTANPGTRRHQHGDYWHWSGLSSWDLHSISMGWGCKGYLVQDDDEEEEEEEVLLAASAGSFKSAQDVYYDHSVDDLPWDLQADVRGIKIYPKQGCVKHCSGATNKCPQ